MKKFIHTPEGVRDTYGKECARKRVLERQIESLFHTYGYQHIETPSFEFFDVFGKEVGTVSSRNLYKFFDRDGNTLALRPDFTPSIARAASMYFSEETMPIRLCYQGSVFINNSSYQGRLKESTQMGVEFLNETSPEADAELVAMAVSVMRKANFQEFQVSIGHAGFFNALADEAGLSAEQRHELKELLIIKNRFGAQELVEKFRLKGNLARAIEKIPELIGDREMLEEAAKLASNPRALEALNRLKQIRELLEAYGCEKYVVFDLGMLSPYEYYTGIIFQAFTYGTGDAVIKGGRYDNLLARYGKAAPAVGFTTEVDALLGALERQHIGVDVEDTMTMVLYPARLEKLALRFAAAHREKGMDMACVRFEQGKMLEDYRLYGLRNQFGGIIYFRSENEVYALNLSAGQTEQVDMSPYLL